FEEVLGHLAARGIAMRHQRPSPYAGDLMRAIRAREPERLVDTLLCSALIEARSCERMRLLADALDDPALVALYRGLLAAEARHHETYVELATAVVPEAQVRARLRELARHEAAVLAAPGRGPLPRRPPGAGPRPPHAPGGRGGGRARGARPPPPPRPPARHEAAVLAAAPPLARLHA